MEENEKVVKTKKKFLPTKKSKIIFVLILLVVAAGIAALVLKLTDKGTHVDVAKVERKSIEQRYDTSGMLTAADVGNYYAYVGLVPTEVNVTPGDTVRKGDILARFDTKAMNAVISEKKTAYNKAQSAYNSAISGSKDTAAQVRDLNNQIAALKKQKDKMPNSDIPTDATSLPNIQDLSSEELAALIGQLTTVAGNATTAAEIDAQITLLEAKKSLISAGQTNALIDIYKQTRDSAKEEYDALINEKAELERGWVATADGKVGDVYLTVGKPYEYVADESATQFDLSSMMPGAEDFDISSILGSMTGKKDAMPEKGIAIVVDYYGGYTIGFTLGKYDLQTVKTGMPAIVSYTDYEYEGVVSYISAHANTSTDIVSSMMGSSTQVSSSVAAKVTVTNPDANLVVGFDAKISILTAAKDNVLAIPVESLTIEDGKMYVFIYDEKEGVAKRQEVEVGISSDEYYELLNGVTEGETIILNASKITDGEKVYAGD